jgi:hypothetical protein
MRDNISSIYEKKEKKNKGFKSGFSLTLFFSGLREASPQAQYALAFIRFS